jgi:hypothetical protein
MATSVNITSPPFSYPISFNASSNLLVIASKVLIQDTFYAGGGSFGIYQDVFFYSTTANAQMGFIGAMQTPSGAYPIIISSGNQTTMADGYITMLTSKEMLRIDKIGVVIKAQYTSAQIGALSGMVEGTLVYNTDSHKFNYFNGGGWVAFP